MSYLKDTNIEAYNQIHIELSELTTEELEHLPNNIIQVIYWQCNHNPSHIWATYVFERRNVETDKGCPFCKNEELHPNGPKLILSRRIYSRIRDNIEHRFHCFDCNHTWSIISKDAPTYYDTCIYCSMGLKIPPFKEKYKEFVEEWDSQSNLLSFEQITDEYPYEIVWRCKKCNQLWESTVLDREHNFRTCPYCAGSKPIPDKTSFGALYPEMLKEYIGWKERNPYEIFPHSNFSIRWKCSICHFPYIAKLSDKVDGRALCPNCNSDHPISVNLYDRIINEYDHVNNYLEMPIEELPVTFKVELSWICNECNNAWKASLFSRLYKEKVCPYCNGEKVIPGKTSFKAMYPNLVEEYSNENEDDPDHLLPSSSKRVIWSCKKCNQDWSSSINDRVNDNANCPYCDGRKVIPGKTSFKAMYPNLVEEYSNENEDDPDYLLPSSSKRIIWSCKKCNQDWGSSISDRVNDNANCPYCDGRKAIPGQTSFKAMYPSLVEEYSNENEDDPDYLLPTSSKRIIWNCKKCTQDWCSSINDRVNDNTSCPYCDGRKAIPGKTSFKAMYTQLMKEWDDISNLLLVDPDMILETCNKIVWWNCIHCGYKYPMSPARKVMFEKRKQISCLKCKGIRRRKSHIV